MNPCQVDATAETNGGHSNCATGAGRTPIAVPRRSRSNCATGQCCSNWEIRFFTITSFFNNWPNTPSTNPKFNPGGGGTYNYHHGRQSFPGDLHNPPPNYYHPNPTGIGHTIGSQANDNLLGGGGHSTGTQGDGGHTYSNPTPVGPLGRNVSGHTNGLQGDSHLPGGGGHTTGSQGCGSRTFASTTPVGPLGRNGSIDSGGVGPIRSLRIGTAGASPSSGGYPSRASQHSRDLDTPTASLRTETATWICDNFKALRGCVGKPKEMVKMAQPLFNIPENERWPASVVMQLCWFESFAGTPQCPLEKAAAQKGQTPTLLRRLLQPP
ncbi:hypothetical protein PSTT_13307 [Puccinia striiformis]|uniref:Uncharacterized protein n=1 Tax=Puccinia striiformis TaxID=27350 RepID=A0A2S4US53_9BASI|nr:hypothetical protein PSTT_13307 [Puccinia striiformis]